jgi:glycosyltransferase involved in cell wall biosynthesis
LKVVIINKSYNVGGAAVASQRLFHALKANGCDVNMLVQDPVPTSSIATALSNSNFDKRKAFRRFIQERLCFLPYEKNKTIRFSFSPANAGIDISKHPLVQEADIIHLHWINQGFLSLSSLDKLFKLKKPVVWTMHDMWPFTGGCHYAGTCFQFIESCGYCPFLRRPHKEDLSADIHKQKRTIWKQAKIHAVSCSKWLKSLAMESSLLRQKEISSIPNPINTDLFSPNPQNVCRERFGLPLEKKLLLFGAANITDPRKGGKYLVDALNKLHLQYPDLKSQLELVVFGKYKKKDMSNIPFKTHNLNFITKGEDLVSLYNAADVFVLPSLQDNLPNTVMESLACGTPVVSFRVGGVPEMVNHKKNGYLAKAKNSDSLAKGIYKILFKVNIEDYKNNARQFALDNYAEKVVAEKYMQLYKGML